MHPESRPRKDIKMNTLNKTLKLDKDRAVSQILFRCPDELKARICRALGKEMARSGSRVSVNDFMLRLVQEGLKNIGE